MKWTVLEKETKDKLDMSEKKNKVMRFGLICFGICILLLCITFTVFAFRLQ